MTLTNPLASSRYTQAMNSALAQGHGYDEASQLAANNFYSTLQQQSLLLGIKTVIGYLLIDIAELFLVFFPLLLYFGNSRGIDRFHRRRNERQNHCRTRKSHELFFHLCKLACHLMTMPFSQPAVFQAPKRYALFAFL